MCRVEPRGLPCLELEDDMAFKEEEEAEEDTGGLVTGSGTLVASSPLSSDDEWSLKQPGFSAIDLKYQIFFQYQSGLFYLPH